MVINNDTNSKHITLCRMCNAPHTQYEYEMAAVEDLLIYRYCSLNHVNDTQLMPLLKYNDIVPKHE